MNNPPKRKRTAKVKWTKYYECHRHTTCDDRTAKRREVKEDDPNFYGRFIQKRSKQVGCVAKLSATCYEEAPTVVELTFKNAHTNHVPFSIEDVQYLQYSDELRERILEELRKGYDVRDIRTYLQHEYSEEDDVVHDAYISTAIVYNIYYKYRQEKSQFDHNDFVSVKLWLTKLSESGYHTWIATDEEEAVDLLSETAFAFGFLASW